MMMNEYEKDLFTVSSDHYLVRCISSDFAMGMGIAKQFAKRGVKEYLVASYCNRWNNKGYCLYSPLNDFCGVYNLVTKQLRWHKPTLQTMEGALRDLKSQVPFDAKIAMPLIGCGLDRLHWDDVKSLIQNIFADTDIQIDVCKL